MPGSTTIGSGTIGGIGESVSASESSTVPFLEVCVPIEGMRTRRVETGVGFKTVSLGMAFAVGAGAAGSTASGAAEAPDLTVGAGTIGGVGEI
jgi:hypothetical protein